MPRVAPRSFRPDSEDLWAAARERAEAEGISVSEVLNAALRAYVAGDGGPVEARLERLEQRVAALEQRDRLG